ncbi:hypothetical protein SELMODRAFT_442137 [Selaginella moellendorffii]|uniref:Uncharacterized protein n=1 Tax=Selaginella moellendorffii TaxID=88036 RepID=D8RR20_SELML|nr:hypothetical protein SELMODRAFT_442137 [Selaginella moellendorffii]
MVAAAASPLPYRLVASVASEAMGIGKSSDVLTVLGGKASCRRKFVLNVHLLDESGNLAANVTKDVTIVASVAYAHDHSPVVRDDKPFLAEPPLFTTFNGVEFPAQERPTRMVSGRASFKLAISLLSSKCDNRLFCICFTPHFGPDSPSSSASPPLCAPCYSKPIRSISRKRTQSTPLLTIPIVNAVAPPPPPPRSPAGHSHSSTLSPTSSPPNSGTLTSDEQNSPPLVINSCSSAPVSPTAAATATAAGTTTAATTRPFKPYASVGACNLPLSDFQLGCSINGAAAGNAAPPNSATATTASSSLIERVQQLRSASPTCPSAIVGGPGQVSLEEEEKSLQYIEVSLQEVNKELQRRKEELRSKRRRIREDEARMHSIIFQSSSWIESLSGRFSL